MCAPWHSGSVMPIFRLPIPSYPTIRGFFRAHGLEKRRRVTSRQTRGAQRAEARLADREVRGYEVEYVGQLFRMRSP